jgi:hypothetical protein
MYNIVLDLNGHDDGLLEAKCMVQINKIVVLDDIKEQCNGL